MSKRWRRYATPLRAAMLIISLAACLGLLISCAQPPVRTIPETRQLIFVPQGTKLTTPDGKTEAAPWDAYLISGEYLSQLIWELERLPDASPPPE